MVDRAVEEALDLTGVQVDRDEAGGAGGLEQVGDQLGRDGLTTLGLPILTGVAVERADGRDALGRRTPGGVDHDHLFHQRVVDRHAVDTAVALDDEDVAAAHVLAELAVDLAVGELRQVRLAEVLAEHLGDLLCEWKVGASREEVQPLLRDELHALAPYVARSGDVVLRPA